MNGRVALMTHAASTIEKANRPRRLAATMGPPGRRRSDCI